MQTAMTWKSSGLPTSINLGAIEVADVDDLKVMKVADVILSSLKLTDKMCVGFAA
jgi:hypothetical protein